MLWKRKGGVSGRGWWNRGGPEISSLSRGKGTLPETLQGGRWVVGRVPSACSRAGNFKQIGRRVGGNKRDRHLRKNHRTWGEKRMTPEESHRMKGEGGKRAQEERLDLIRQEKRVFHPFHSRGKGAQGNKV